jgi:hypothetical protein
MLLTLPTNLAASSAGRASVGLSFNDQRQFASSPSLKLSVFVVSTVSPSGGILAGDTPVQVAGIGFAASDTLVCRFGSLAPVPASFLSSTKIACMTPPAVSATTSTVQVSVDGITYSASSSSPSWQFYSHPATLVITPRAGPALLAGTFTALSGSGYVAIPSAVPLCQFGGIAATGTTNGPSSVTCSVPSSGPGVFEVRLALNGLDFESTGATFAFFSVTTLTPSLGPVTGSTIVAVTGNGFVDTVTYMCLFERSTSPASFLDAQHLECRSPSNSSVTGRTVPFAVSINGVDIFTSPGPFTFFELPSVSAFTPRSGPGLGGTLVTLEGSFPPASSDTRCRFGSRTTAAQRPGPSTITCPTPAVDGSPTYDLALSFNNADYVNVANFSFFVTKSLNPSRGPATGGTRVTVSGEFFLAGSGYWCNVSSEVGVIAGDRLNDLVLTCVLPSMDIPAAPLALSITTDNATFAAAHPFLVYPVPVVTAISPSACPSSGCTVTLYGSDLASVITASFSANATSHRAPCAPPNATEPSTTACTLPSFRKALGMSVSVSGNDQQFHPAEAGVTFNLTACDLGTFANTDADACAPCQLGTYADTEGARECKPCIPGTFANVTGLGSCFKCPTNTFSSLRSEDVTACTCASGFFHRKGLPGVECEACPKSGECAGGTSPALARPGFWASKYDPFTFIPCDNPSACKGGNLGDDSCQAGYMGRMCSQCRPRYFRQGDQCLRCPNGAPVVLLAFVIFAFIITVLLIRSAGKSMRAYSGTIGIATKFFQVLAVIGRLNVLWPASVKEAITTATTPFTLKMGNLAPECSAPAISYEIKWAMTMLLPLFFAVVFGLLYLGALVRAHFVLKKRLSASLTNRFINGFLSLMSLGFLTLASTAIEPFGCRLEKDGSYSLVADPSKLCFAPWWKVVAPFAAVGIAVYVIGIPVTLFWWLRRNRNRLSDPHFVERYGGLYSSYVPGLPHWEALVMVEKIAVAAVGLLMNGFVVLQIIFLQLIFVVTLSVYQAKTPYVRGKDNLLHAQLRWCSLLVLCAGMVFKMNDFPGPEARRAIEIIALVLIVAGTAIVVSSVAWNLWRIRQSLRVEISEELERTFTLFSPHGRMVLTRWLRKASDRTQDGLQTKLQHVLQSVKRLCDAVKPPARDPSSKKSPRAMDEDVPFVADDPVSDAIVATFCSGTFRDDLIPIVRTWVDLQSQASPAQLRSFAECFSALGRFNLDQEQSKAKSTATSERLARNVTNRLTRRSSKRLSSAIRTPDLFRPLTLLETLYGPKLSSYASETPPLIEDPEFLRGIQAFYCRD